MKMKCDVIKDLMPSYIDQLLTEESRILVEEHLEECEACKAYYETLKGEDDIFEAAAEELHVDEIQPLKKIKKKMSRKTMLVSVVTAIFVVCLLLGLNYIIFHHEHYVPYEDAGISVTLDGKMYVDEKYYSRWEYANESRKIKFICFKDSLATKNANRSEEEINQIVDDFNSSIDTTHSTDGGKEIPCSYDEVYYLTEEYVEKFKDRYFLINVSPEEEDMILEDMKSASILLWKRPNVLKKTGNLTVHFTAKVEMLIEDPNLEGGAPRYVVARTFQSPPFLFDAGIDFGKTLEAGETYTFNMKPVMIEEFDKNYSLETLISVYDLTLESVSVPQAGLEGLESVDVQYEPF